MPIFKMFLSHIQYSRTKRERSGLPLHTHVALVGRKAWPSMEGVWFRQMWLNNLLLLNAHYKISGVVLQLSSHFNSPTWAWSESEPLHNKPLVNTKCRGLQALRSFSPFISYLLVEACFPLLLRIFSDSAFYHQCRCMRMLPQPGAPHRLSLSLSTWGASMDVLQ